MYLYKTKQSLSVRVSPLAARDMTSLILGSLRRERSSTLRALRPCCINDLWLRLDCRICWPRKRSEATTATLLASDARSARLMDDMTILALAPRTGIRNQLLDDLPQHLTSIRRSFVFFHEKFSSNSVLLQAAARLRAKQGAESMERRCLVNARLA